MSALSSISQVPSPVPPAITLFHRREELLRQHEALKRQIDDVTRQLESELEKLPAGPEGFANEMFALTLGLLHDY